METWEWIAFGAAAAVVLLVTLLFTLLVTRRRRRAHLQERFGPEYYRSVSDSGRRQAERRLSAVEREHEELEVRDLPPASRERFLEEWRQAEIRFVSDPRDAVRAAERVVVRVLEDRGYPVEGDPEERTAHLAADHPDVVERYRHGQTLLEHVAGRESTENLRRAMLDFRAVFEELLEDQRMTA